MRRPTRLTLLSVLAIVAALVVIVLLRREAPPEPARLLPGAEAFAYVDLKWVRRLDRLGQVPPVAHDPEYDEFICETGFQFERDLDEAAFAIHYAGTPAAPGREMRFTEVFTGRWNSGRVAQYLGKLARSVVDYRGVQIFDIPLEGRTLRVAMLGVGTVAVSNSDDPEVIRGIIDRSRKLASPFGGPALLRRYYKYVPLASLAWAIFNVDPVGSLPSRNALSFLFTKPATVVASARYLGHVNFRAEAFTGSPDEARRLTEQLGTFLRSEEHT